MAKKDDKTEPGEQLNLIDHEHEAAPQIKRLLAKIRKHDGERKTASDLASEARLKLAEVLTEHKIKFPCRFGDTTIDKLMRLSIKGVKDAETSDNSESVGV